MKKKSAVALEWEVGGGAHLEVGGESPLDFPLPLDERWTRENLSVASLEVLVLSRFLQHFPQPSEHVVSYVSRADGDPGGGATSIHPTVEVTTPSDADAAKLAFAAIAKEIGDVRIHPKVSVNAAADIE